MKSVYMEDLSWFEIKEAMENGVDTVLVGAASHEQHGPHLPENTDYVIGYNWFGEVARRLGNALVAPVIRPGLSPHHMGLKGSLTLRPEVFSGIVEDYVNCLIGHGFKKILLVQSHGGNSIPMSKIAEELNEKYPDVIITFPLAMGDFMDLCIESDEFFGLEKGACGGHADCFETAIMLHLRPDLVNMERAERGYVNEDSRAAADRLLKVGMMNVSPCGILGDATPATAEMGAIMWNNLCDTFTERIRKKLDSLTK